MSASRQLVPEDQALKDDIAALGPWFHNLRLRGVQTAPDHFLGDYPEIKFASFRHAIPADLTGKSVLDIGCNAGFYTLEMKRRGAAEVLGIDTDEHYLQQARFAAEVEKIDVEFRRMTVWDVASLGRKFDLVIFMGVLYHLRHPLLALDPKHAARMQRHYPRGSRLRLQRRCTVRQPGIPEAALRRASLRA
jgi:tRNA (mo5U34)-methyltransferase